MEAATEVPVEFYGDGVVEKTEYDCLRDAIADPVENLDLMSSGMDDLEIQFSNFSFSRRSPPKTEIESEQFRVESLMDIDLSNFAPPPVDYAEIHPLDPRHDEFYVSRRSIEQILGGSGGGGGADVEEQGWEEIDYLTAALEPIGTANVNYVDYLAGDLASVQTTNAGSIDHLTGDLEVFGTRNVVWELIHFPVNDDNDMDFLHIEPYTGGEYDGGGSVSYGCSPASWSAVEALPSVVITDTDDSGVICAVCKDEIPIGEAARRLPCLHYYHGKCIIHWLSIRNTCPVCRYELPTDDLENASRVGISDFQSQERNSTA